MTTNVLIVLADQFRADCLGVAANPDVRTPTLDRLAGEGVHFPNSFCVAPLCTPSRYTLLTGYLPAQHGVHGNNEPLNRDLPTLPERARAAGVRSTAVGKMHFTPTYMDAGFETMRLCEQNGDGRLIDDYHRELTAAGLVDGIDLIDQRDEFRRRANDDYWDSFGAAPSDLPEQWHSTAWTATQAIDLIDGSWAGGGQLMYLSFVKPHHPFDPPEPWDQCYDPEELTLLPGWTAEVPTGDAEHGYFDNRTLTEERLRQVMALYYGTISHLDHHLGRVIDHLRSLGAYDNTLIIFTSDHGEYLGFHHMLLKSGPMYDPVVKVPLIMKPAGPGLAERGCSGITDDRLTSGADVVPTALASLGLLAPDELTGHDLTDPDWTREVAVTQSGESGYMARSATAKLLKSGEERRLIDLEADPFELSAQRVDAGTHLDAAIDAVATRAELDDHTAGSNPVDRHATKASSRERPLRDFDELLTPHHRWLT